MCIHEYTRSWLHTLTLFPILTLQKPLPRASHESLHVLLGCRLRRRAPPALADMVLGHLHTDLQCHMTFSARGNYPSPPPAAIATAICLSLRFILDQCGWSSQAHWTHARPHRATDPMLPPQAKADIREEARRGRPAPANGTPYQRAGGVGGVVLQIPTTSAVGVRPQLLVQPSRVHVGYETCPLLGGLHRRRRDAGCAGDSAPSSAETIKVRKLRPEHHL